MNERRKQTNIHLHVFSVVIKVFNHPFKASTRRKLKCSFDLDIFQDKGIDGVLYSTPVSNYSARCRFVIYAKELPIEIHSPPGGLKSDEYKKINPLGKIPALWLANNDLILFESEVINEYLVDRYIHLSPSFVPNTTEKRAIARLVSRIHDLYIGPFQYALYRECAIEERRRCFQSAKQGLELMERVIQATPFAAGERISLADVALFPSLLFWDYLAPRYYDWYPLENKPKLIGWYQFMKQESPVAEKVYNEVLQGLETWESNGRFEKMGLVPKHVESFHKN
eukprot:jgi/Galph1/785/GphlegSOOS_G5553.1